MLQRMSPQNKILCLSFGIFLILFFLVNRSPSVPKTEKGEEAAAADTYIPPGHVLVPIQVENSEALGAVMGPFAVVDLYSEISGHSSVIAEKVKLIRAPLNPRQFAVLVTESLSTQIMQVKFPFSVVLQNRNSFKANLEKNLLLANDPKKFPVATVKKELMPQPLPKPVNRRMVQIEYYEKNRL